jgi:hypothetical protein
MVSILKVLAQRKLRLFQAEGYFERHTHGDCFPVFHGGLELELSRCFQGLFVESKLCIQRERTTCMSLGVPSAVTTISTKTMPSMRALLASLV